MLPQYHVPNTPEGVAEGKEKMLAKPEVTDLRWCLYVILSEVDGAVPITELIAEAQRRIPSYKGDWEEIIQKRIPNASACLQMYKDGRVRLKANCSPRTYDLPALERCGRINIYKREGFDPNAINEKLMAVKGTEKPKDRADPSADFTKGTTKEDLRNCSVAELKAFLTSNGVVAKGKKTLLINSVHAFLQNGGSPGPAARKQKKKRKKQSDPAYRTAKSLRVSKMWENS